jgi:hypothetical protein
MDRVTVIEYYLDKEPHLKPTVWSNTRTSLDVLTYLPGERYKVGDIKQHTSNLKTKGYTVIAGSEFWSHIIIIAEKHPMFNVNLLRHSMNDIKLTPKSGVYEFINNWSREVCLAAE